MLGGGSTGVAGGLGMAGGGSTGAGCPGTVGGAGIGVFGGGEVLGGPGIGEGVVICAIAETNSMQRAKPDSVR